jgi:hypothetical protein
MNPTLNPNCQNRSNSKNSQTEAGKMSTTAIGYVARQAHKREATKRRITPTPKKQCMSPSPVPGLPN